MNDDIKQLERSVLAELEHLGPQLDAPPPRAEWVRAVQIAVGDEIDRWYSARRRLALLRSVGGLAAALLLAVGLLHAPESATSWLLVADQPPEQAVEDWLGAIEDSSDQLAELLEQAWTVDAGPADDELPADPFKYLEESLDYFNTLSG